MKILLIMLSALLLVSCANPQKYKLEGGKGRTSISTPGFTNDVTITQPENPERQSRQDSNVEREETVILPAGTIIREESPSSTVSNRVYTESVIPVATVKTVKFKQHTDTVLGGAQKNTAFELAAKAASLKPVQYAGIGLILIAVALAYFKWFTPAIVAGGAGIGLIVLSSVLVSHELLIAVVLGVGMACYIIFYSYNKGALDGVLPDKLDKKKPNPSTVVTVTQPTPKPPDVTVVSTPVTPPPPSV